MLLRLSRGAAALTKESGLGGAALGLVGKGTGAVLGTIGRAAIKHPAGALGTVAGVAGGAAHAIPRIRKGDLGMSQRYMQARRWGYAPPVVSRPGSAWRQQ